MRALQSLAIDELPPSSNTTPRMPLDPTPSSAAARRRSARGTLARAGYTMVEVMMGLAILAVGATGIISLQQFTIAGAQNARASVTAANVASTWVERLRTEAIDWNNPDNTDLSAMTGVYLKELVKVANVPATAVGTWVNLPDNAQTILGENASPTIADDAAFCTHFRGTWLGPASTSDTLRLEVRTFWAKSGRSVDAECALAANAFDSAFADPNATVTVNTIARNRGEYGVLYLTAIIRRNIQ